MVANSVDVSTRQMRKSTGCINFSSAFLNTLAIHHPPPGTGRVHRLRDDDDMKLPNFPERKQEYLMAIASGATSRGTILKLLSFQLPAKELAEDLEMLGRDGAIKIARRGSVIRYLPPELR